MRYLAQFTPQVWVGDYAVTADAQGDTRWDVTAHIAALSAEEQRDVMEADTDASDTLRWTDEAPAWVGDWSGPFAVSVAAVPETDAERVLVGLCSEPWETLEWQYVGASGDVHQFRHANGTARMQGRVAADGSIAVVPASFAPTARVFEGKTFTALQVASAHRGSPAWLAAGSQGVPAGA